MSDRPRKTSWIWALVALLLGLGIGGFLLWTAPQTEPADKVQAVKIVQTVALIPREEKLLVTAYGPVIPARKVTMEPQVHGRIIQHHPALVPGGHLQAGEELLRIDPSEYQLALQEQEAALEEARFELEVEKGRQVVALREWRLLERDLTHDEVNRALVLREPHLLRTEAMVRKATNEIAKAKLDLERTRVTVPFNAMVLTESVEIGQLTEPGSTLCTLVGTDEFWVQATLPLDKLGSIQLPGPDRPGATATVLLETGNGEAMPWTGRVVRLLSDLDPVGRMARLLVEISDPLRLNASAPATPLLLGSYVRVDIEAGSLPNVLTIPRSALREGNRIWVVDTQNRLQIRDAKILWSQRDSVLIPNVIEAGEQLVVSGLKVALPGMRVEPIAPEAGAPSVDPSPSTRTPAPLPGPEVVHR